MSAVTNVMNKIDELSLLELEKVQAQIQDKIITHVYGREFSRILSAKTIFSLPVVEAKQLDLDSEDKYYVMQAKPSALGNASAVRGINGRNCPFVAVKIDMLDSNTHELIAQVVEVVFKRYGNDGDGRYDGIYENNYVTTLYNTAEDGTRYTSCLYDSGGMKKHEMQALKDLLDGKTITSPHQTNILIRMAKN